MIAALLEAALRALLLALLVGSGLVLFRVRNVLAQKLAWALVLAAAIAMPLAMRLPISFHLSLPAFLNQLAEHSSSAPVADPYPAVPAVTLEEPSIASSTGKTHPVIQPVYLPPATHALTTQDKPSPGMHPLLALSPAQLGWFVYIAILAVISLRLLIGFLRATFLWHSAEPVNPKLLPADLSAEYSRQLRSSPSVRTPVTVASGVLLPAGYTGWDTEKLRIVLAHELSHLRQRDFYLQLLAGLHAALFWFSPLGWWLKRKLSDLSETISDRAALAAAADGPSYAQVLLEFAALPRPTFTGVPMARTSNISRRIERLLNESAFHRAFAGGRARLLAAALLVPLALVAATAAVHVQAGSQEVPPAPPVAPLPIAAPAPAPLPPPAPAAQSNENTFGDPTTVPSAGRTTVIVKDGSSISINTTDGDSWAMVPTDPNAITYSGTWDDGARQQIDRARKLAHGPFLWFTHDGKSYIVDDPAIVNNFRPSTLQMEALKKLQESFSRQQEDFSKQQMALGEEMKRAALPTPEMKREIAELDKSMSKLQEQIKKAQSTNEWADLQSQIGNLQGRLGEIQGEIGERQGEVGERMGKLGELQGELGEKMGKLGEQQGQIGEDVDKKIKSSLDEWIRAGKARPMQ